MTNAPPASVTPEIRARSAHFDVLFSTILYGFLDGATKQVQDRGRAMDDAQASICAAIARSPIDRSALISVALESIPFPIKEAFGCPSWSWQAVSYSETTIPTTLSSGTGVYAYYLTKINQEEKQDIYIGQTTSNFASRFATHARRRKAEKRPKKYSSKLYGNLKLTRPKNIKILILADISIFQEDVLAHKMMARILEACFCVFFDSLRSSNLPGSDESISFARRWLAIRSLSTLPFHLLTVSLVVQAICPPYRG